MGTRSITSPVFTLTMTATCQNSVNTDSQYPSVSQGSTYTQSPAFTSGTTDSKFDRVWQSKARAILSAASENIDVYDLGTLDIGAGAGLDAVGQSWTVAEVVAIQIKNLSTSTGSLVVGGEGSAAAWNSIFNGSDTATITLPINTVWGLWTTSDPGYAVADTTNHLLKMAASGGNVDYDITIFARSA